MTAPRCRWSFGLRTLFAVVTAGAILAASARLVLPTVLANQRLLRNLIESGSPLLCMDLGIVLVSLILWKVGNRMKARADGRVQYAGGVLVMVAAAVLWFALIGNALAVFELLFDQG